MSVVGPKSYEVHPRYLHLFEKSVWQKQWFQKIRVNQTSIEVETVDLSGRIEDSFKIMVK